MKFKGLLVGDLSGSMNGVTASRNKSGGYFRERVTPTNPQTIVQQLNRASFGSAGSSYHTLTSVQKSQWNAYANSTFKPKGGRVPGVTYSGQNAYASSNAIISRANQVFRQSEIDGVAVTATAYNQTVTPPTNVMSGFLAPNNPLDPPVAIRPDNLTGATFTASSGQVDLTLVIGNGATLPVLPTLWRDSGGGDRVGIAVYMHRNFVEQDGLYMGGSLTLVGNTGLISVTTPTTNKPTLSFVSGDWNLNRKLIPNVGEIVRLALFLVDAKGQSTPIGAINATTV